MNTITRWIHRTRTLRVNILTLFLSLILVVCLLIISISYYKTSASFLEFATGVIERSGTIINERTRCLVDDVQQMAIVSAPLISDAKQVSPDNTDLVRYMLTAVKADSNLAGFAIGTDTGNFMNVGELDVLAKPYYTWTPSKPLPPGASFLLVYLDRTTTPPLHTIYYKDDDFKTLDSESSHVITYDPRKTSWYIGAANSDELYWTPPYTFFNSGVSGITAAKSITNGQNEVIAVLGADLTFELLDKFLEAQTIGMSGKAYILDASGQIIMPKAKTSQPFLSKAFAYSRAHQARNFVLNNEGTKYLVHMRPFPIQDVSSQWFIAVIAPFSDFFSNLFRTQDIVILISMSILVLSAFVVVLFSKKISSPIVALSQHVNDIRRLELDPTISVRSKIAEIALMSSSIEALRVAMRSFARYVPRKLVSHLIEKGEEITLSGEKQELTILFSDIAGFSAIAEAYPVDTLCSLLAEYFDALSKIILADGGTIDKYIGDSIMVFWGAPTPTPDHPAKACRAALSCQAYLIKLNAKRKQEGVPEFPTRFGINTGSAIVGNIGTLERMNYTIIGDAVNVAARLQSVDKEYHTTIIISEEVRKRIGDEFLVRPLDVIQVKGKHEQLKIYELVAARQGDPDILPTAEQQELCAAFTAAHEAFYRQDYAAARALFEAIHQKFPDDFPTQRMLARIITPRPK